jgi:putative transposase
MLYRRTITKGGTYFFTVNLADRSRDLLAVHVDGLRSVMRKVQSAHPFEITAMVVLPDHLHSIWVLPSGDADYAPLDLDQGWFFPRYSDGRANQRQPHA